MRDEDVVSVVFDNFARFAHWETTLSGLANGSLLSSLIRLPLKFLPLVYTLPCSPIWIVRRWCVRCCCICRYLTLSCRSAIAWRCSLVNRAVSADRERPCSRPTHNVFSDAIVGVLPTWVRYDGASYFTSNRAYLKLVCLTRCVPFCHICLFHRCACP